MSDLDGFIVVRKDNPEKEYWVTGTGQFMTTHPADKCAGEHCVVHNPSDHNMRNMRTHWRSDRGITERICEHGVGHPDPDDPTTHRVHGCDGCCSKESV